MWAGTCCRPPVGQRVEQRGAGLRRVRRPTSRDGPKRVLLRRERSVRQQERRRHRDKREEEPFSPASAWQTLRGDLDARWTAQQDSTGQHSTRVGQCVTQLTFFSARRRNPSSMRRTMIAAEYPWDSRERTEMPMTCMTAA